MNPKPKKKRKKKGRTGNNHRPIIKIHTSKPIQYMYMRKHTKRTISPNPKTFAHLRER